MHLQTIEEDILSKNFFYEFKSKSKRKSGAPVKTAAAETLLNVTNRSLRNNKYLGLNK